MIYIISCFLDLGNKNTVKPQIFASTFLILQAPETSALKRHTCDVSRTAFFSTALALTTPGSATLFLFSQDFSFGHIFRMATCLSHSLRDSHSVKAIPLSMPCCIAISSALKHSLGLRKQTKLTCLSKLLKLTRFL